MKYCCDLIFHSMEREMEQVQHRTGLYFSTGRFRVKAKLLKKDINRPLAGKRSIEKHRNHHSLSHSNRTAASKSIHWIVACDPQICFTASS